MSDWPESIEQNWFAIARSSAVTAKPKRIVLFGRRWAIARASDGHVLALEDRCPHRHAPLSAGRMTAQGLQCPYHGWTFSRSGTCVEIPGLCGDQPPEVRIPTMTLVEHDGLVWGAARPVTDSKLPRIIVNLDPARRRVLWQTQWGAPVLEALENFLDPLHTHLIHPGLVRRHSQRMAVTATLTRVEDGFTVDYQSGATQSGILYRLFEPPRTAEQAHFCGPGVVRRSSIGMQTARRCGSHFALHPKPRTQRTCLPRFTSRGVGRRRGRCDCSFGPSCVGSPIRISAFSSCKPIP